MNIILIGMNHKTAPLEIRERLSLTCGNDANHLAEIMKFPEIQEVLYLATCNRVEVLANAVDTAGAVEKLRAFIFHHGNLSAEEMARCLYLHYDDEAVRHLFRVASSIDSMVMGEPQILGQVKDAYRTAVEHNTTGVILNRVLHHAFRVAKRVRTETGIAHNAVSVSFAAVELAKKIFGSLEGKTILLIGAGEMSELAARHLLNQGVRKILIANRTYARALQMAENFHGTATDFDTLAEKLRDVDIVISSTGAPGYVITPPMIEAAIRRRKNRLLFLIDIAVPRDIDPAVNEIDNVYLYNIDNLQDIVDTNVKSRQREAEKAEAIIDDEVGKYHEWFNTLEVVPTIISLREKMEGIVKSELVKSGSWMQNLNEEEKKNIEILAGSIINKILHDPITGLKEESRENGALPYIAALRRLFGLDDV
ncbi:MAG: glutamyl-tRNA reductase [Deltaproteobacteria bacterium]|nr:glutamyl-tRNA reductase [Deltaproteobacteria bacterium]